MFLFVLYVQPSAATIAPASASVYGGAPGGRRRMVDGIIITASISVAGGLFLYWRDWHDHGSFAEWIGSSFGATLDGGVASLAALAIGVSVTRPNVRRLTALIRQVAESGGPPSPEVTAEMAEIQRRLRMFARMSLALLVLAVLSMAVARLDRSRRARHHACMKTVDQAPHALDVASVVCELDTDLERGLDHEEAQPASRGPNALRGAAGGSLAPILRQFADPLVILLLGATVIWRSCAGRRTRAAGRVDRQPDRC